MDFLDFEGEKLYFDEPLSAEAERMIAHASEAGRDPRAEEYLMRAFFLEPNHLTVLVALYRFFYYTQRFDDAMLTADRAMDSAARQLGLMHGWRKLTINELGQGVLVSMGLTRFYLLALKASGFILLRMHAIPQALERLNKLAELDPADQFGARPLIELAEAAVKDTAISLQAG